MAEQQEDKDQRTENATPQRILKARQEGQVAFSSEFVSGLMLASGVLLFWGFGQAFFGAFGDSMRFRFTVFEPQVVDPRMLVSALINDTKYVGTVVISFMLVIAAIAAVSGLLQTNFNLSFKPLNLDVNKLNPTKGTAQMFSSKGVVKGALSIAKASVLMAIVYWIARSKLDEIATSGFGSFRDLMFSMCEILLYASLAVAAMMTIVGLIDLAFQRWKHLQDLKMSMRDIKDENKESEGDPLVRARVRKVQAEMSRNRALADVPKASVVITNPTHFAVAVQYDRDEMEAPIVLAKGADHMARKIIEIAKENGVPVVERKPVARFLHANVEIGNAIPFEMYQAVAEVLNFVNQMRHAA